MYSPTTFRIEITGKCNLGCKYCYNSKYNRAEFVKNELDTKKLLSLIKDAFEQNFKRFTIIGGEPLLRKDLYTILDAIKSGGGTCRIATNGMLVNDKFLDYVKKNDIVKEISISLDGTENNDKIRIGSNYKKILKSVSDLSGIPHLRIFIISNCNSLTKNDFNILYEELKKYKIAGWRINNTFEEGSYSANREQLLIKDFNELLYIYATLLRKYFKDAKPFSLAIHNVYNSEILTLPYEAADLNSNPCAYFFTTMTVKPSGKFIFCPKLDIEIANLNYKTIAQAKQEMEKTEAYGIKLKDIMHCNVCKYISICGGGCRAEPIRLFKTPYLPDPFSCMMLRRVFDIIVPLLPEAERQAYLKLVAPGKEPHYEGNNIEEIMLSTEQN